jgi:rRNA processing protein Gar1
MYFMDAVDVEEVPDYLEIIKRPMHLQRIWDKVCTTQYIIGTIANVFGTA